MSFSASAEAPASVDSEPVVEEGAEALEEFVNKKTGERGGPKGLEPVRYGDWEKKGRCIDF